jgi:6-pyruvoyltetrahydropterin/6-carboxytetrahydropterin synthase
MSKVKQVTVCRKAWFNAAHRLHVQEWSDAKNQEFFGLCNNPNYHGHNYELTVKVHGEVDPVSGYVMDMKILKDLIKLEVEDKYDHRNLNEDTDDFKTLNPTAENIAIVIYQNIKKHLTQNIKLTIILNETDRNYVEYTED